MNKPLNLELLLEQHTNQQFTTLEEEFQSFQIVAREVVAQQNDDAFITLFGNYSEPFILFGDHYEVLQFFYEIEQLIHPTAKKMLAVLYLIIGHCYYIKLNKKMALRYYKKSTSLAFECGLYNVLSITINNAIVLNYDHLPNDILFEHSKMPIVFYLIKQSKDGPFFIYRMHTHIEMAIRTKRYDYAQQLFEQYFENANVDENSRFGYQIRILKADLLFGTEQYQEAQAIYHDILMRCIVANQLKDLILHCYKQLAACDSILNEAKQQVAFMESTANYLLEAQFSNDQLERHFNSQVALNLPFANEKVAFEQAAKHYFKSNVTESYTLIIIELKTTSDTLEEPILTLLQQTIRNALTKKIVRHARMDPKTLAYIVELSEDDIKELMPPIFEQVRTHYPKQTSGLEAIYYAGINNKTNNITSYDECFQLAYAYIYYEYYK